MTFRHFMAFAAILLILPLAIACGDDDDATPTVGAGAGAATTAAGTPATTGGTPAAASPAAATGRIAIGSKNFTEQLILGEMYAQLLESHGFTVDRKLNLGGTAVAHEALLAGEIDLYPEYTGTGLLAILSMETMTDADEVYETVKQAYQEQFNLVWLDQAPMNNSNALAVTREFSEEHDVTTISQLVEMADEVILAAVPDFPEREDGLVGLQRVYGPFEFQEIKILDPGLKYQAFLNGDANVVLAFGTDGQVAGYDLVILEDDKGLWPPYHVAPVVRQETLDMYPQIADELNALSELLTSDVMSDLNWRVDGPDAMEPEEVARDFLTENDLLHE
jgi:osmoprotectant transport system substrate-binding protein